MGEFTDVSGMLARNQQAAREALRRGAYSPSEGMSDDDPKILALVGALRNERRRWYDLREYAVQRGDLELSAAMDAASERYAERARTGTA